jgi:hypothetical protein
VKRGRCARWLPLLAVAACGEPLHDQHYQGPPPMQLHVAALPDTDDLDDDFQVEMAAYNGSFGVGLGRGTPRQFRRPRLADVPNGWPRRQLQDHDGRTAAEVMVLFAQALPTGRIGARPRMWVSLDHLLVLSRPTWHWSGSVSTGGVYIGGQRIPIELPVGYHLVRRRCRPDEPFQLELVDPGSEVTFTRVAEDHVNPLPLYDQVVLDSCGITSPRPPAAPRASMQRAQLLAWAPDGTGLFLMHVPSNWPPMVPPRLDLWSSSSGALETIAFASFTGGLKVGSDGRVFADQIDGAGVSTAALRWVSMAEGWRRETLPLPGEAVLSATGGRLAASSGSGPTDPIVVYELASGTRSTLVPGEPLVWSPAGDRLLVHKPGQGLALTIVDLQGKPLDLPPLDLGPMPPAPAVPLYLWPDDKPLVLIRRGRAPTAQWPTFAFSEAPARSIGFDDLPPPRDHPLQSLARQIVLHDLESGAERILLEGDRGPIAVEAALSGDGRFLFAFTISCHGFSDEFCGVDLHRISLADGKRIPVARLPQLGPLGASHDGSRIAISTKDGVFVLDVP